MSELTNNPTFIRSSDIVEADIDGEKVMMDIESGHYYGLDVVASRIWQLLEQPLSLNVLVDTLTSEFDVSPEKCREDIEPFLNDMLENNIISLQD